MVSLNSDACMGLAVSQSNRGAPKDRSKPVLPVWSEYTS